MVGREMTMEGRDERLAQVVEWRQACKVEEARAILLELVGEWPTDVEVLFVLALLPSC